LASAVLAEQKSTTGVPVKKRHESEPTRFWTALTPVFARLAAVPASRYAPLRSRLW
jgi:hypothetical protein